MFKRKMLYASCLTMLCQGCSIDVNESIWPNNKNESIWPNNKGAFNTLFRSPTEIVNTSEGFAMSFNRQGQGIAVVGGPESRLRFHSAHKFKVSTEGTKLAEEISVGYPTQENFVLDENGTGQFFVIQSPSDAYGIVPGNEPQRNNVLVIYTLPIQNYKVVGPLQTLSFEHRYATLHHQSLVVDPEGKGTLTLKLSEADTGSGMGSRRIYFVALPIKKHMIQQQLTPLNLPFEGNLALNGDLDGAYLFQQELKWFLQSVEKGHLKGEPLELPFASDGVSKLSLSATGVGYASLQAEQKVEVQRLRHFVMPYGEKVAVPRWNKNSQVRIAFNGEQGFSLELSEYTLGTTQLNVRLTQFTDQVTQSQVFQREVLPFDDGTPPQIGGVILKDAQALFLWHLFDKKNQAWQLFWEPSP